MNIKDVQNLSECVLAIKANVYEPALLLAPVCKAAIIKGLLGIFYDKRNDVEPKAFFKRNQPADPAIPIPKGVNAFKVSVEFDDVFNRYAAFGIEIRDKARRKFWSLFRSANLENAIIANVSEQILGLQCKKLAALTRTLFAILSPLDNLAIVLDDIQSSLVKSDLVRPISFSLFSNGL